MDGESFAWDEAKAFANYVKHGVSFETAIQVFADPFAIERQDDRENYGEERWVLIGMAASTRVDGCVHRGRWALQAHLGTTRNDA